MAEDAYDWSPYRYGFDNPVSYTDPTGMFEDWYEDEWKKLVFDESIKSQADLDAKGIKGEYKGETGYGINEETGALQTYLPDGTIAESSLASNDITVKANPIATAIYQGQKEFINHPVTQATISSLTFVATGGIEGVAALGRAGASLFSGSSSTVGRVFWSGGGNPTVQETARNFAIKNGMTTLEMTNKGKLLTGLTNATSYSLTKPLWQRASASFAKGASGTVNVFQNAGGIGTKSVWGTIEYPILKTRGTNIIYHIVP